jgi:hypothetical protein
MYPPQGAGAGITWSDVKTKLESEGSMNVLDFLDAYALYKSGTRTISEIASIINNINATVGAVEIENHYNFSDFIPFLALAFDNANLTAAKAASIFDNANLTAAKGASIFDNANLTAAKGASIFDNANLTVAKAASIFNHDNLTAAKLISILDNANITSAKIKSIFETGSLTVDAKRAAVLEGDQYSPADAALSVNGTFYTVDQLALAFNNANLTAAKAASIFDNANLTAAKAASIFDNAYLTATKAASIFANTNLTLARAKAFLEHANLSISRINSIIIDDGISDSRAQEILNETAWATRDLTGAASILYAIHDDWEDNKAVTSRDNRATTPASILGANQFAQKFRPLWTTVGGTTTCSAGKLISNEAADRVKITSTFMVGTWEINFRFTATAGGDDLMFYFIYVDSSNWYAVRINNDTAGPFYKLRKKVTGTESDIISSTLTPNTIEHTCKLTRDASGNFELFFDGVSKGTATNNEISSSSELHLAKVDTVVAGSSKELDNLKVY